MKWQKVRLCDIGTISRGRSRHRPRNAPELYGGKYPFVQTADVKNADLYLMSYSQSYNEYGLAQSKLWPKGTMCITIAANIADTCILGIDACFPDSIIGFVPDTRKCDIKYIKYKFDYDIQRYCKQMSQGATQDNLSQEKLLSFQFEIPPLPIQQKIADVLGAYDDLIENNRRRIELLEKVARELYRERFVRRRGNGTEVSLLEVFDFVRGKSYASNEIDVSEGVPMVNLKNIRAWGGYNSGAERLFSGDFKDEQTLGRGDVIMGVTDMTQDRRIVGHVALVPTLDQTATFSMDIIKLIPKGMSNVELYSVLRYSGVSKEISQLATGATVLHLRPGALDSVRIWVPQKSDFEEVEQLFSGYYSDIDNLVLQNRNLAKQRDRLLPRLMSGKLDVSRLVKEGV